jgi:hypothetical protein
MGTLKFDRRLQELERVLFRTGANALTSKFATIETGSSEDRQKAQLDQETVLLHSFLIRGWLRLNNGQLSLTTATPIEYRPTVSQTKVRWNARLISLPVPVETPEELIGVLEEIRKLIHSPTMLDDIHTILEEAGIPDEPLN